MSIPLEAKFSGCLLGGAIGDALGMPSIGASRAEIAARDGGRDFCASPDASSVIVPVGELGDSEPGEPLGPGQWTEDTQLTLALAEALLQEGGVFVPEAWSHKLVQWVNSAPRLPGTSTLQAALQLRTGGVFWDEAADPEGAGAGAAARVAPLALLYAQDPALRRRTAVVQAQVTHGHPDAQAAALAMAEAVARLLPLAADQIASWDGAAFLQDLASFVADSDPAYAEFARCLDLAHSLLIDGAGRAAAIQALGVSGWSREAVPCALYCLASAPTDLESLLIETVRLTGGATDTIAAMVGTLGGAMHGIDALPARWQAGVEESLSIIETARALYRLSVSLPHR